MMDKRIIDNFNQVMTQFVKKIKGFDEQFISITSEKTDKTTTTNLQQQVNNLVLGSVGDGNNAEVIQARGGYNTLNERCDTIENICISDEFSKKQLFYTSVALNSTINGLTIKSTKNSSEISIKGTASTTAVQIFAENILNLKAGTYTISGAITTASQNVYLRFYKKSTTAQVVINNGIFTLDTNDILNIGIRTEAGVVVDETLKIMINKGSIAEKYEPYITKSNLKDAVKNLEQTSILKNTKTYNLFDINKLKRGYSIDNSGNIYQIDSSLYNRAVTDYIPVTEGEQVTVSVAGEFITIKKSYFDISGTCLLTTSTQEPAPTGTVSFVIGFADYTEEQFKNLLITKGAGVLPFINYEVDKIDGSQVYYYGNVDIKDVKTWYFGKNIDCLGDSITESGYYQRYISSRLGCNCYNHGIGGTRLSGSSYTAMWQDVRINALNNNSDMIIVAGGTNDISSYGVGDISLNNTDTNTLCGAINTIITKIYLKFGYDIPILFILPPFAKNKYDGLNKIGEEIKEVLKLWGLSYVDTLHNAGINNFNSQLYLQSDDVHPNILGAERNTRIIVGKMKEIEPINS